MTDDPFLRAILYGDGPLFGRLPRTEGGFESDISARRLMWESGIAPPDPPAFDHLAEESLETGAVKRAITPVMERHEYELRGEGRAGYDYVHVYRPDPTPPLGHRDPMDTFSVPRDVLDPSNDPEPNGHWGRYVYTYDLTAVPDAVIRDAIQEGR